MFDVNTVVTAPPAGAPARIVVEVRQNHALMARIQPVSEAWHLHVIEPVWTIMCDTLGEAYKQYANTCREAGVSIEGPDDLTLIEIKERREKQISPGYTTPHVRPLAQVSNLIDGTWHLNVFLPEQWNRVCRSAPDALDVFAKYANPTPERDPVGGR